MISSKLKQCLGAYYKAETKYLTKVKENNMKTVGELITELQKYPEDMGVVYQTKEIGYGMIYHIDKICYGISKIVKTDILPYDSKVSNNKYFDTESLYHAEVKKRKEEVREVVLLTAEEDEK